MPENEKPVQGIDFEHPLPERLYFLEPTGYIRAKDEDAAYQVLSMAMGCKLSKCKEWFTMKEMKQDKNGNTWSS